MTLSPGRLPSSQSWDHLVYLRAFEGCNLYCKHCFIPSNPRLLTDASIRRIPDLIHDRIPQGSTVLIQWHGGEPTLVGPDFIRSAIDHLASEAPQFTWRHAIQTNLMTYGPDWATLYHEHFGGEVGVSWDPKIRLLNRHAPDSFGAYNAVFETKLRSLIDDRLSPYLVVTVTRALFESFPNPFDFLQKWVSLGVTHVHLERVTRTGHARTNWSEVGLDNREYSEGMARWARAYTRFKAANPDQTFFLSPFDDLMTSITTLNSGNPQARGCWSGRCDTRFHTIDGDGYKPGCTALTSEIGNRNADPSAPPLRNDLGMARELRTFHCGSCEFRRICSTGCLALSFDDGSGECSGGSLLFAGMKQMAARRTGVHHEAT